MIFLIAILAFALAGSWTVHQVPFTLVTGETVKKPLPATMPGGIAVRPVWAYAQARTLAVRRLPSISDQERLDIVAAARQHVGKSYGWSGAVASKLIPPRFLVGRRALYQLAEMSSCPESMKSCPANP